jgi:multicomponent Na+:H+ antiporter subunit G
MHSFRYYDTMLPDSQEVTGMSALILDVILYLLLLAALGFGAISVIGLLLFPDIRSRSFTGLRAGILAITLVTVAGMSYGIYEWITSGSIQYLLYAIGSIMMLILVLVLNRIATDIVCRSSVPVFVPSSDEEEKE